MALPVSWPDIVHQSFITKYRAGQRHLVQRRSNLVLTGNRITTIFGGNHFFEKDGPELICIGGGAAKQFLIETD